MADASVLGTDAARCGGSSPFTRTKPPKGGFFIPIIIKKKYQK